MRSMQPSALKLGLSCFVIGSCLASIAIAQQPPPPPPPQSEELPKIIRKSGGVLQGSATRRVEPAYPPLAKAARVSGAVVVEVTIDEEGNVISARAISGHPLLKDSAIAAARGWTFNPTLLQGMPVKVIGTITFSFRAVSKEEIEALRLKVIANPNAAELHYELADLYKGDAQNKLAIDEYKQALNLEPNYVEAYLGLGEAYDAYGRTDEAIETYRQGLNVTSHPGLAEIMNVNLGAAYLKRGSYEEALEAFKRAVAIDPESVEGHYNLGLSYLRIGDKQSAWNEYAVLQNLSEDMAEALRRSIEMYR